MSDVLFQSWIMLGRELPPVAAQRRRFWSPASRCPVLLMFVFVFLFGGAIDTGTAYVTYVLPAVILLSASFWCRVDGGERERGPQGRRRRSPALDADRVLVLPCRPRRSEPDQEFRRHGTRGRDRVSSRISARRPVRSSGSPPSACCRCSFSRSRGSPPPSGCSRVHPRLPVATPSSPCSCRTSAAGSSRWTPCRRGCRASPSTSR